MMKKILKIKRQNELILEIAKELSYKGWFVCQKGFYKNGKIGQTTKRMVPLKITHVNKEFVRVLRKYLKEA